jgi:hypothetical protein
LTFVNGSGSNFKEWFKRYYGEWTEVDFDHESLEEDKIAVYNLHKLPKHLFKFVAVIQNL